MALFLFANFTVSVKPFDYKENIIYNIKVNKIVYKLFEIDKIES